MGVTRRPTAEFPYQGHPYTASTLSCSYCDWPRILVCARLKSVMTGRTAETYLKKVKQVSDRRCKVAVTTWCCCPSCANFSTIEQTTKIISALQNNRGFSAVIVGILLPIVPGPL